MEWTDEQKVNIIAHYGSVELYEYISAKREAENYLADTDYVVIKAYEYTMTGEELDNDYTEIFKKREEARNVLRNLKPPEIEETKIEEQEESDEKTENSEIEETEKEG